MKSQSGVALLVSLVVLVVAILLGLSSFQSSLLEERMAGNHRLSVSALQSAEAGVDKMLDTVLSYTYTVGDEDTLCDGVDVASEFTLTNPYDFSDDGELRREYLIKLSCDTASNKVVGLSRGYVLNKEDVELSARKIRVLFDPPGWTTVTGMISDSNITINGKKTSIVGVVHANGDLDIQVPDSDEEGDPLGYLTATGTVTLNKTVVDPAVDGVCDTLVCASSNAPRVDVPKAADQIAAAFSSIGESPPVLPTDGSGYGLSSDDLVVFPHDPADGSCTVDGSEIDESYQTDSLIVNDSGMQYKQTVFYCPGKLTIEGDFNGAVLMADGDIIHNGSSELGTTATGGQEVDTFMYATGGIKLNGENDSYGEFVSDGYLSTGTPGVGFFQAGTSTVYGTIISTGDITANGGMDFEAMETGMIRYLSSGRLDSWDELEDPGLPGIANM
ncbi:PilX-like prepilin protein [Halomonas ventosae]|uniref:PilX-like prepilin protein n=1 Tax=Halomonas ventosae TaxID=229007 RepID=A0A4R6ZH47_9GAMM|nr:pilus assembly PilX N-terminal domain-containing protein [Halomonas ventosae]TDR51607.1 PilX-like prepilin protein [Halomonas ventosae]